MLYTYIVHTICMRHTQTRFKFQVQFANCQPGYELKQREDGDKLLTCTCVDSGFDIQACDEKEKVIVLRVRGRWGTGGKRVGLGGGEENGRRYGEESGGRRGGER